MTILLVFAIIEPMVPFNEQHFSELGVLGPNQQIGGYPSKVIVGQPILLFGFIGNHEGSIQLDRVLVKLGANSTIVSNSTAANAPIIYSYSRVLDQNQSYVFPINITLNNQGSYQRLIFELWDYNITVEGFQYTGIWAQLFINVTDS